MKERLIETKWLRVIEAAQHLKMGRSTVHKPAQEGKLPAHKVGRQWRFDAKELEKWLKSGKLGDCTEGKGAKDRVTMLPASLKAPLLGHPKRAKNIHARD